VPPPRIAHLANPHSIPLADAPWHNVTYTGGRNARGWLLTVTGTRPYAARESGQSCQREVTMKSTWFKLFFYAVLVVAILGCVRMALAALRRSHRQVTR